MKKLIYIADDEENIRSLVKTFMENEGYEVETFSDGYSIKMAVNKRMPDLILLDIMMPGEDGLSVCSGIRKISTVPIIIISAKDSPMDRVTGITLGSDDYIVKPFLPLELVARVKALFRRAEMSAGDRGAEKKVSYQCGNMLLDQQARKLLIQGAAVPVTPTEFDFLLYLFERKGSAVAKTELLEQVWGYQGGQADVRASDDLVKRLRKKLRERRATGVIETVWGYGYRLAENKAGAGL